MCSCAMYTHAWDCEHVAALGLSVPPRTAEQEVGRPFGQLISVAAMSLLAGPELQRERARVLEEVVPSFPVAGTTLASPSPPQSPPPQPQELPPLIPPPLPPPPLPQPLPPASTRPATDHATTASAAAGRSQKPPKAAASILSMFGVAPAPPPPRAGKRSR